MKNVLVKRKIILKNVNFPFRKSFFSSPVSLKQILKLSIEKLDSGGNRKEPNYHQDHMEKTLLGEINMNPGNELDPAPKMTRFDEFLLQLKPLTN